MYKILSLSLFFLFLPDVHARDVDSDKIGWYLGGEYNFSKISIEGREKNSGYKTNDSLNGWAVYSGINIHKWLGIEFGVSKADGFNASSGAYIDTVFGASKFSYDFDNQYSLYVKPGFVYAQLLDYPLNGNYPSSWSDFSLIFMTGIEMNVLSDIYARFEYKYTQISLDDDRFLFFVSEDTDSVDVDYQSLGISLFYTF